MADALIGTILGKYKLVSKIGKGGMATVYRAHQTDVDRYVALKVLEADPNRDETQLIERFKQEARTVARLQHPYIVPLYDYGDADGILYLVTPLMEAGSLAKRMRGEPLSLVQIERILRQLADALDYAHGQGVIHRDIKPDNILMDAQGNALLVDFGIAKVTMTSQMLTATGTMVGTPAYMSPQQAQGLAVDASTDQYSLAVIIYEMLAGELPFKAETAMQVVVKHITAPVPSLISAGKNVSPLLDGVMQQALAKNPADRYPSVTAFADAFSDAIRGSETSIPAQKPISTAAAHAPTAIDLSVTPMPPPPAATLPTPTPTPTQTAQPQTVIIQQQGMNPLFMLAGFGIIAVLLIVIVAVLVLGELPEADELTETAAALAAVELEANSAATSTPEAVALVPTPTSAPTFGRISFTTTEKLGDSAILTVERLAQPPAGQRYYAWLTDGEEVLSVGELTLDALGSGVLIYVNPDGTNLPTRFNQVLITAQEPPGTDPGDVVAYRGGVPAEIGAVLGEILVESDDGIQGTSLLASALTEASIAAQHAGLAAGARTPGSMHLHAEHTINILLGTQDDIDGNGRGENPGRGFGVGVFLERIDTYLIDITSMDDASRDLQIQAELILVCTQNAAGWVEEIIALEREMAVAETLEEMTEQRELSTQLAERLIDGFDLNGNDQIEPFEGECGLTQIGQYGILVGNLPILPVQ